MHIQELLEAMSAAQYVSDKLRRSDDKDSDDFARKVKSAANKKLHDRSVDYFKKSLKLSDDEADKVHRLHVAVLGKDEAAAKLFDRMVDEIKQAPAGVGRESIVRTYQQKIRNLA